MKKWFGFAIVCFTVAAVAGCGRTPESGAPIAEGTSAPPKSMHASYSLQWVSNDIPQTMAAGVPTAVRVSVKNTGDWPWPDPMTGNPTRPDGTYAVRLSYRWAGPDGKLLPQDSVRGELTAVVPPGETANYAVQIVPPRDPGNYQLQVDLVEELVTFFSAKGTEKLVVPVTVK